MKAAVMYPEGALPQYVDFPEPTAQKNNELLVRVKAVAIKHFDKGRAAGKHYSSDVPGEGGKVIGGDGVCLLEDGTKVYAMGISGMLAEKAVIDKDRVVRLPDGLDDATAAAIPNAVIGAAMGLRFKAAIQPGDVVLINGATGFHTQTPIDVIIDYLWGHTAEMIFACLKGDGSFTNKVRYVSVGAVTGDLIQLSAANLRSVDLQLTGSGLGAWSKQQVTDLFKEILPEMFVLAAEGKLKVETITVKMEDIAELWNLDIPDGRRLVVTI